MTPTLSSRAPIARVSPAQEHLGSPKSHRATKLTQETYWGETQNGSASDLEQRLQSVGWRGGLL